MQKCPFCMTEIPDDAIVCRACGAEKQLEYDIKPLAYACIFIVCGVLCIFFGNKIISYLGWIGFATGGVFFVVWLFSKGKIPEGKNGTWVRGSIQKS